MKIINKHSNAIMTIIVIYAIFGFVGSLFIGALFKGDTSVFIYCIVGVAFSLVPLIVVYHMVAVYEEAMNRHSSCLEEIYMLLKHNIDAGDKEDDTIGNAEVNIEF